MNELADQFYRRVTAQAENRDVTLYLRRQVQQGQISERQITELYYLVMSITQTLIFPRESIHFPRRR